MEVVGKMASLRFLEAGDVLCLFKSENIAAKFTSKTLEEISFEVSSISNYQLRITHLSIRQQDFPCLKQLNLSFNAINSLSGLSSLATLEDVNLFGIHFKDSREYMFLQRNRGLQKLYLAYVKGD